METDNWNARIAGASFIISYLGLILGAFVSVSILDGDYLALAYPNAIQLGIGMLLESLNGIAVIGIAVMLYPILKRYNEGIALAYLGFRGVEALLSILGSTKAIALVDLSHEYIQAGSPTGSYFETFGALILADRHWHMEMLTLFFILGALIFYFILYRTELLPRYVAVWGFVATLLIAVFNVLIYTGIDLGMIVNIALVIPIIANEIFVAIWLIVKGLNTSAMTAEARLEV
ncbi:MAG: DUF4386 domain-containing protein [Candidatus Thorarchaeota archaeon]|jgi:hypothetical protein